MPTHAPEPAIPAFDLTVGRHPEYGIIAVASRPFAGTAWMLEGFDFHPAPDHDGMYVLANQHHDPTTRATRAIDLLRRAGYHVHADLALDPDILLPTPNSPATAPPRPPGRPSDLATDVAFAEHPRLGIVAATTEDAPSAERAGQILHEHGFRYRATFDVYDLPPDLGSDDGLRVVARTALAMNRAGLKAAVQPALARDVAARGTPAPAEPARQERSRDGAAPRFPTLNTAALTTSPARVSLPATPPVPAPASTPASRPADPRTAFSRTR